VSIAVLLFATWPDTVLNDLGRRLGFGIYHFQRAVGAWWLALCVSPEPKLDMTARIREDCRGILGP
jgi:hypothetical protein